MAAVIFAGSAVKTLKKEMILNEGGTEYFKVIGADAVNPQVTATEAEAGSILVDKDSGRIWKKMDSGSTKNWVELSTESKYNLIGGDNSNFLQSIGNWAAYKDALQDYPEDGTGGTPTLSISRELGTTYQLDDYCMLITPGTGSGGARQGQGASVALSIPTGTSKDWYEYALPQLELSFQYGSNSAFISNGGYSDGSTPSWIVPYIYDVDNGVAIPLSVPYLDGSKQYRGTFQAPPSDNLRLCFHCTDTGSISWLWAVQNIKLTLATPNQPINAISDWVDGGAITIDAITTAPTKGTTSVDRVLYRQSGPDAILKYEYQQSGGTPAAGSGNYLFTLPSGLKFDSSKVTYNAEASVGVNGNWIASSIIGYGTASDKSTGSTGATVMLQAYDDTRFRAWIIRVNSSGTAVEGGMGSALLPLSSSNTSFAFDVRAPILGWTSGYSHPAQIGLNSKVVLSAYRSGGTWTGSGATITSWTSVEKDSVGMLNNSTGVMTIKSPGDYRFEIHQAGTAVSGIFGIHKNGTLIERVNSGYSANGYNDAYFTLFDLTYGDEIELTVEGGTLSNNANTTDNWMKVYKLGSQAQPYAPRVAYLKDVKSSGTGGGTFTSGSFQTRVLNTIEGSQDFVSLSSNQITLQPGKYLIRFSASGYFCDNHKAKLRNISDSSDEIIGSSSFSDRAVGNGSYTTSYGMGEVIINTAKTFELQHRCQVTGNYGIASSFGISEVYAQVDITKVL